MNSNLNKVGTFVNQPLLLEVLFYGQGNAKFIDLPDLQLPPDLEVYDIKKESQFFSNGRGERRFKVLLVPRKEGYFKIPPIRASAFDSQTGEYYSMQTAPHQFLVRPAPEGQEAIASSPLDWGEELDKGGDSWPGLMTSWKSQRFRGLWLRNLFLGLLYIFVFAFLGWRFMVELGWARRKEDLHQFIRLKAPDIHKLLEEGKWRLVGISVTNLVYRIMGLVSGQGGGNLELDKLILASPPSVRRDLGEILKRQNKVFETLGFAPDEISDHLKDKKSLEKQLLEIEETLLAVVESAS